jgi:preprotein translocase subunit SecG
MGVWYTVLAIFHVIVCVFLITVVLLQQGKGGGMGVAFGGGSSGSVFGARGAGSFLGRLTAIVATVFMLNSVVLAYMSSSSRGLFEDRRQRQTQRDDANRAALGSDASISLDGDAAEEQEEEAEGDAAPIVESDGAAATTDGSAAPDEAAQAEAEGDDSEAAEAEASEAEAEAEEAPSASAGRPAAAEASDEGDDLEGEVASDEEAEEE